MEPALIGSSVSPPARRHDGEPWRLSHVQPIFGGTTEIQEIIARSLGF